MRRKLNGNTRTGGGGFCTHTLPPCCMLSGVIQLFCPITKETLHYTLHTYNWWISVKHQLGICNYISHWIRTTYTNGGTPYIDDPTLDDLSRDLCLQIIVLIITLTFTMLCVLTLCRMESFFSNSFCKTLKWGLSKVYNKRSY